MKKCGQHHHPGTCLIWKVGKYKTIRELRKERVDRILDLTSMMNYKHLPAAELSELAPEEVCSGTKEDT